MFQAPGYPEAGNLFFLYSPFLFPFMKTYKQVFVYIATKIGISYICNVFIV